MMSVSRDTQPTHVFLDGRSVIADIRPDFAAKYPIGPARVHQDHRQEDECADQQKRLRSIRGRSFPQSKVVGHDHRIKTDRNTDIRQHEEPDGADERQYFSPASEGTPGDERDSSGRDRNRSKNQGIGPGKPPREDGRTRKGSPNAYDADGDEHTAETNAAVTARHILDITFGLERDTSWIS